MDNIDNKKDYNKDLAVHKRKLNLLKGHKHLETEPTPLGKFMDRRLIGDKTDNMEKHNIATDDTLTGMEETEAIRDPSLIYKKTRIPNERYESLQSFIGKQIIKKDN